MVGGGAQGGSGVLKHHGGAREPGKPVERPEVKYFAHKTCITGGKRFKNRFSSSNAEP